MSLTEREIKEKDTEVELGIGKDPKKVRRFSKEPNARWLIVILCIVAISAGASLYIYKGGLTSSHATVPASLPAFPKVGGHRLLPTSTKSKSASSSLGTTTTTGTPALTTSSKNPFTPIVNTSSTPGTSPPG